MQRPSLLIAVAMLASGCYDSHRPAADAPAPPSSPARETPDAAVDLSPCGDGLCAPSGPIPEGAVCHELRNHAPDARDQPFIVNSGEALACFFYTAPWAESSALVAWQTEIDSDAMHEWRLIAEGELGARAGADGSVDSACLGSHPGARLLAGSYRGGNDVAMPAGVGVQLPPPGSRLTLEWLHLRDGTGTVPDASTVRVCTLPVAALRSVAGLTILGSEDPGVAMGLDRGKHSVSGRCTASADGPALRLHMLAPHMRRYGRRIRLSIERAGGERETVLDRRFDYEQQNVLSVTTVVRPGDTLVTTCDYEIGGSYPVSFGPSVSFEQCYLFAFTAPVGALDNPTFSMFGVLNHCFDQLAAD